MKTNTKKKTATERELEITLVEVTAELRTAIRDLTADRKLLREEQRDTAEMVVIRDEAVRLAKMAKTRVVRETLGETADDYWPDSWSLRDAQRDVRRGEAAVKRLTRRASALRKALGR